MPSLAHVGHAGLPDGEGAFRLPDKDSGRYELKAETGHDGKITPLSTKTSVAWEFDSQYTEEATPLAVSGVNFTPEGLSNGYAKAGEEQKFNLDYMAQDGAPDTDLKDLSFEVSYDDGKNWDKVDVSRDGDSATGTFKHPVTRSSPPLRPLPPMPTAIRSRSRPWGRSA